MAKETTFEHPPKGHIAIVQYDPSIDDWRAVYVDASGRLQVDIAAAEQLEALAHQYDGAVWRKSNLLWGYNDRVAERKQNLAATIGSNDLDSTAVPAGEVHVISRVSAFNTVTANSRTIIKFKVGSSQYHLESKDNPAAWEIVGLSGQFTLKEGDQIRATFEGCAAGDDIFLDVWGYKMKVDM